MFLMSLTFIGVFSCSEEALDKIDENLNNPTDVSVDLILPVVQTGLAYSVIGGDMSLYASVWVQHTTGVHAQLHQADRFEFTTSLVNNTWNSLYLTVLKNADIIIEKAAANESWHYVGVSQVLYAYAVSVATDAWGRVPYTQATKGAEFSKPQFDSQESIYTDPETGLLALLDDAIANLEGESRATPGSDDLIYGGDMSLWVKAAYALKAKILTRIANTNGYSSADVLDAVSNSFVDASEAFVFTSFATGATNEHPWFQEANDRTHLAVSESFFNLLGGKNDPRADVFFDDGATSTPAPNGNASLDQGGDLYSKIYNYVTASSPLEIITYDQLRFFEAEAHLRGGDLVAANDAYEAGVVASLERYGVGAGSITAYTGQPEVFPGAGSLSLDDIHEQRYISYYPFQSQEAYASWRRTGIPALSNPNGDIPRRMPYPQGEIDTNPDNIPSATTANGVWWDDGSED